jgi:LacI family transcriptional regulator
MTIIKIAQELGVSPSTVSRAMNNSHQISDKTKEKVNAFLRKIDFHPNPQASSLKRGTTKTIAVIIPDISNYFFTSVLNAIEELAHEKKFHILIYQTQENHLKEVYIVNELLKGRVDGVIISVTKSFTKDNTHLIRLNKLMPVVLFDRILDQPEFSTITCNDYESGFKATNHLIKGGCTNIFFLGLSDEISVTSARLAGYKSALNSNNFQCKDENILLCSNEQDANYKIRNALIKLRPDAIFSTVERYTVLLYALCHELEIVISKEIKIISFFNSPTAALMHPPLSTITHPASEMGKAAIGKLFQKINNRTYGFQRNSNHNCRIKIRKSSE